MLRAESSSTDFDVAVIGAGAAGLCAALELCRQGRSVVILEARERVGGRIDTRFEPGIAHPIELGAEFIHGEAPLTRELLRAAGIAAVDTSGRRVAQRDGHSRSRAGDFEAVQRLMSQATHLAHDLSVDDFLERFAGGESMQSVRGFVRMMVEGFDAADPREASVQAIAAEWGGQSLGGQCRPLGGYAALLGALTRALEPTRTRLMLGTTVRRVQWGGARVLLDAQGDLGEVNLSARRAIVSLPIGVLQARGAEGVRFEPGLVDKQVALEGLALGPVIKVVLHFRRPFWEQLENGRFTDAGFLHAPEAPFPTLWTALPFRVPLLTAWMGGPRAQRLAAATRAQRIEQALTSVQQILQLDERIADELVDAHVHDWGADPHARGAYCYLRVGAGAAPAALARPLAARLFFAGEATHETYTGTVEAALQSGRRAALELLAAEQAT